MIGPKEYGLEDKKIDSNSYFLLCLAVIVIVDQDGAEEADDKWGSQGKGA